MPRGGVVLDSEKGAAIQDGQTRQRLKHLAQRVEIIVIRHGPNCYEAVNPQRET
jgi:hypothetical protein